MTILDGKATAKTIKAELKEKVQTLVGQGKRPPHLAAVLVGDDGASQAYVGNKVRSCQQVGFESTLLRFEADMSEAELLEVVRRLNDDDEIDGFIVQLPLPKHISEDKITLAIDPQKDVDGFHPDNVGRMIMGKDRFLPATPAGIIELLKRYQVETSGKHAVVVGRSNIVGRPMSILLSRKGEGGNATVTLTHSRTKNLTEEIQRADIIIAALGIPEFVTAEMVKEGAIVIDVGITRVDDASKKRGYSLKGDVKYDEVAERSSFITPVPGGVGPMTVAALMLNTMRAYEVTFGS